MPSQARRSTQQQWSGGRGQVGDGEQAVRVLATVKQAHELASMPVALGEGRTVRLAWW